MNKFWVIKSSSEYPDGPFDTLVLAKEAAAEAYELDVGDDIYVVKTVAVGEAQTSLKWQDK